MILQENFTYLIWGFRVDSLRRYLSGHRSLSHGHPGFDDLLRCGHSHGWLFRGLRRLDRGLSWVLHLFSRGILEHFLVLDWHLVLRKLVILHLLRGRLIDSDLLRYSSTSCHLLYVLLDAYLGLRSFRLAERGLIVALSDP